MEVKVVYGEQGLEEGERRVAHADDDDARVVDDLGLRDELARQEEERAVLDGRCLGLGLEAIVREVGAPGGGGGGGGGRRLAKLGGEAR